MMQALLSPALRVGVKVGYVFLKRAEKFNCISNLSEFSERPLAVRKAQRSDDQGTRTRWHLLCS